MLMNVYVHTRGVYAKYDRCEHFQNLWISVQRQLLNTTLAGDTHVI